MTKIQAMNQFDCQCAKCKKILNPDKHAHFHHLRSYNKKHNMSEMFNKFSDLHTQEELNKTILLCDNCHKALHKALGNKVFKKDSLAFIRQ